MYKIMISVGEASGDLHGASVAKALKELHPEAEIFGMGGKHMADAGVDIVYDIADIGVMGIVEVIKNLRKLYRLKDYLLQIIDERKPDVLVVIDYPGFNMKLAKAAKDKGIPVVSYISPSAWAWGPGRAVEVAQTVERVAAIFPFEAEVYEKAGAKVTFVGHPLLDIVKPSVSREEALDLFGAEPDKPIVLLMPGSRQQEIVKLLPVMLASCEKVQKEMPNCQFFLPVASTISREMLENITADYAVSIKFATGHNYDLMQIADVAIAASGTATLETSLLNVPTVIIYKVAALTYMLGKLLVKIPHVGLPNIIAGRQVVPELLQNQANAEHIAQETLRILADKAYLEKIRQDLLEVKQKLGEPGAVNRVAKVICEVAEMSGGRK